MRQRLGASVAAFVAVLLITAAARGKEPAEIVYEKVHPCVVSLRNAEGSGTGLLLDRAGLILTNAHVVMSPLPFEAKIDLRLGGEFKTAVFRKVTLIGVHPSYDLALVKIDPAENKGALLPAILAKEMPKPGKTVYAIGNPGGGEVILTKTITAGLLSGVREMDGQTFLQVSAAINPGNSGGPLCDGDGNVVGIVTFKLTDVENIGFAIPTKQFTLAQFVPFEKRKANAEATRELSLAADKYLNDANAYIARFGNKDPRVAILRSMALRAYWLALMNSPGDATLYYNVGMVYGRLEQNELAIAYLARAMQLDPWGSGNYFRELGLALVKLKRVDEGLVVYREGVAKFPGVGKIYEDLAITHMNRGELVECAYAAQAAIKLGDSRANVVQNLNQQATAKMSPDQQAQLKQKVAGMDAEIKRLQGISDKAKASKKKFINNDCDLLLKKLGTLEDAEEAGKALANAQNNAPGTPGAPGGPGGGGDAEKPARPEKPVKPVEAKDPKLVWIEKQLDLAALYRSSKQWEKVKEICQEIIARHPDHPRTKDARDLLKQAEKGG